MAANKAQGRSFAFFLVALAVGCVGIATWSTGIGKLAFVAGAVALVASLFGMRRIKPEEGKPAQRAGSEGAKLGGAFVALLGWLVTLGGLHIVSSTGGRIVLALVGIAISLFGMVVLLPRAVNKNAIWKA
ncbi:MAG TPA: hypothetical protein VLV45_06860 [Gemmatimonadales bacterium]|nr:hypothetical protein [Gemmatimonadales bacterium]